jgi:glycosyltransferase involved in cell wall biosynthesis
VSGSGFSVVIPAHNALPDVLDAVQSALGQTLPPDEIIVVDDGSTDRTGDAVEERFGDRVRVLRGTFGSAAAARNAGWRTSRAPWVALLDADDLWFPTKLETAREVLERHPRAVWFFSDGAFRELDGTLRPSWFEMYAEMPETYFGQPVAQLVEVNFILTSSLVVRREAVETLGGFDESMSHAEDLDLWIRLARRWPAAATRRSLIRYQHRPGGLTRQTEARLQGDITLFERLAADATLDPDVRRRARHRVAMAHYKFGWGELRERRGGSARRHLRAAWMFPERALPVAAAWAASLLPDGVYDLLRKNRIAKYGVAAPMVRPKRVVLQSLPVEGGAT